MEHRKEDVREINKYKQIRKKDLDLVLFFDKRSSFFFAESVFGALVRPKK